mmetsp:Transcript_8823/g.25421  ORF Transcript_8823/g.25421 Transcript_8823/m.25421 type:complete len:512 (-) Transcript_8823:93-1628(-)
MALNTALCRVLLISSLAFNARNDITLEFSTPPYVAPSGMLFCFVSTPQLVLSPGSAYVVSLSAGGDQFNYDEQEMSSVAGEQNADNRAPGWPLSTVEVGTIPDLLGTDPYYAHSYNHRRYDDFVEDDEGNSLQGLVIDSEPEGDEQEGNCMLITGQWRANTRYEITLRIQNPVVSSQSGGLTVWMAPMTYSTAELKQMAFRLRGPPYGTVCDIRAGAYGSLQARQAFFDACGVARSNSVTLPANPTELECISGLQQRLARDPALANTFPYWVHPFNAPVQLPTLDDSDLECEAGQALSLRNSGECVTCSPPGNISSDGLMCTCPSNHSAFLVGQQACGGLLNPSAAPVNSAAQLAQFLCAKYKEQREMMWDGRLSDRLVNAAYLDAFTQEASLLMDKSTVFMANRSMWGEFSWDERQRASPSREQGMEPNCNLCDGQGNFTNFNKQGNWHIRDVRYEAAQTFRAIGASLDMAGFQCTELFDPRNPLQPFYGPYEDRMCEDIVYPSANNGEL